MNFWRSKFFDVKQLTDGIVKRGEREGLERRREVDKEKNGGSRLCRLCSSYQLR